MLSVHSVVVCSAKVVLTVELVARPCCSPTLRSCQVNYRCFKKSYLSQNILPVALHLCHSRIVRHSAVLLTSPPSLSSITPDAHWWRCRYPACYAAWHPVELPGLKLAEHKFCLVPHRLAQFIRTMEPKGRLCQSQRQRKQLCPNSEHVQTHELPSDQQRDDAQKWLHDRRAVGAAGWGRPGLLTEARTHPVRAISVDNRPPRFNSAINTAGV